MSEERLKKLGLLSVRRDELRQQKNRVQGILGSLCDATFVRDPENPFIIDGQKVMDYAAELYRAIREGNAIKRQIEALQTELGIED